MQNYTASFDGFGMREIEMAKTLLDAILTQGFPEGFDGSNFSIELNPNSGNVFLVDEEYTVAMMNGDKLELFYSTPYEGFEGFREDLEESYHSLCAEDQEFVDAL